MSLIDQALKKTQSALHQKTRPILPKQPIVDRAEPLLEREPLRPTVHAIPRGYKKRTRTALDFNFVSTDFRDFMTNRWVLGALAFVFAAMLVLSAHQYLSHISQRYTQFYGHLFDRRLPAKNTPKPIATPPKPITPAIPLQLNGTLQMNSEHVALINHQLYHAGETIDGYKILHVRYNHVDLQNIETHQVLELLPELSR
ncbi:MAG: hypothetical protein A3F13_06070 [Gammaproteobacteria bacterium RIFCSPHIGHO2_12_FULL_40_19]|nr:MAG: hypothetical protein A3F13_06070 [Gammaproteobacteria bacterium RIFCSPHIGHO2_12_FULL_40_19]